MRVLLTAALIAVSLVGTAISASAFSADRNFAEIIPLKASMLTKQWQGLLLDVDQKVGIVPELGSTSVGVQRFGDELARRTHCARQFEWFYQNTFALALADKEKLPQMALAKRKLVPGLSIDGRARGPGCAVFATLSIPATLALVERTDDEWNVLALTVNPTERNIEKIVESEVAMLSELCARARTADASVRLLSSVKDTLAGDLVQLGLSHDSDDSEDDGIVWLQCEAL
mmetsp:Transcript_16083/g.46314  ORF Transcript_16083/g.46314 Transcript_16083/m.46314 type:complete len:230 (-) Transcript_16083:456-1145(-)